MAGELQGMAIAPLPPQYSLARTVIMLDNTQWIRSLGVEAQAAPEADITLLYSSDAHSVDKVHGLLRFAEIC